MTNRSSIALCCAGPDIALIRFWREFAELVLKAGSDKVLEDKAETPSANPIESAKRAELESESEAAKV